MKNFILLIKFLLVLTHVHAQAVYQSSTTAIGASGPAVATNPTATAEGDLLLLAMTYEKGSSEVITAPAGWTLALRTDNGTNCGISTYYKIAGASEPASYSFAMANGSKWSVGISRFTNVNNTTPIEASNGAMGIGAVVSAPSLNTMGSGRLVLCVYTNKKASTYTPDLATTERYDNPNTAGGLPSLMLASFQQSSTGTTPVMNATATDPESWSAQQIAIVPASFGTLPVKFHSYFVVRSAADYNVMWSTSQEINTAYFEVERSEDGNNWKSIARIAAAVNSSVINNYHHTDRNVNLKTVHYRVKQADANGMVTYTSIRSFTNNNVAAVNISNNSGQVSIRFTEQIKGSVEISLLNMNGQTISRKLYTTASSSLSIPAPASVKGQYIVQVRYESKNIAKQVLF